MRQGLGLLAILISLIHFGCVKGGKVTDRLTEDSSSSPAPTKKHAKLSLSPSEISSLNITDGTSPGAAVIMTVTNTGDGDSSPLVISPFTGSSPNNFRIRTSGDECTGQILRPNSICTFQIEPIANLSTFYRTVVDVTDGSIRSNAAELSGSSGGFPGAKLTISPPSISNMNISTGVSPGAPVLITVTNNGDANSDLLEAPTFWGNDSDNFELVVGQDNCTGTTLSPTNSCTFQVHPIASDDGAYDAFVGISDQSLNSTPGRMSGTATGFRVVELSLTPTDITTAHISDGLSPGLPVIMSLTNTGDKASALIQNPLLNGANVSNFEVVSDQNNCTGISLGVGETCTFQIRPLALHNQTYAMILQISDADGVASNFSNISGEASGFPTGDNIIFFTSTNYDTDFGGLIEADKICQAHADSAGLASPYKAVLSTSKESAANRLSITGAVKLTTGTTIANDRNQFWSSTHLAAINRDEKQVGGAPAVWSGTGSSGDALANTCSDWTSKLGNGTIGYSWETNGSWIVASTVQCSTGGRSLYCLGPENLNLNLIAAAGSASGRIDLSLRLPADITNYNSVQIRRQAGAVAPSSFCDDPTDTIVHTNPGPFSTKGKVEFSDDTTIANSPFSYRACIYNASSDLVATAAKQNVFSKNLEQTMFITSIGYDGAFGADAASALSAANSICQSRATAGGLPGTWTALLSNSTQDVKDRVSVTHRVVDVNGKPLVNDPEDFWIGELLKNPNTNELAATTDSSVWTGSWYTGTKHTSHCLDWTNSSSGNTGHFGNSTQNRQGWLGGFGASDTCNLERSLYCLSDPM